MQNNKTRKVRQSQQARPQDPQWQYRSNNIWNDYSFETNKKIEKDKNKSTTDIKENGQNCTVDFAIMQQRNKVNYSYTPIRRIGGEKPLGTIVYGSYSSLGFLFS